MNFVCCPTAQCVAGWLDGVENPAVIEAHLTSLSNNLTQALEPQLGALINDVAALIVRFILSGAHCHTLA